MKVYVTKLCDIDSIGIPDEMLEVHIDKKRIEKQIAESYKNEERVSDTAIMIAYTGDEMASVLDRYMGCNVIKDRSVAEYTRMIEETFFSVVYEE